MATDRIDRGGEETEEEPLVNGFTDLSMREKDEEQQREDGESAREVVEMFTQKTGQYLNVIHLNSACSIWTIGFIASLSFCVPV